MLKGYPLFQPRQGFCRSDIESKSTCTHKTAGLRLQSRCVMHVLARNMVRITLMEALLVACRQAATCAFSC